MPKFAANLSMMFTELDFLERFRIAANCGFAGVEFLFPYRWKPGEIAEQLFNNGLKQVLFNLPPGDWATGDRGLAALPGREQEFEDSLVLALDYAEALNCPQIHVLAGVVGEDVDRNAAEQTYIGNLQIAAESAKERGVRALIEPINTKHGIPGYFLNTIQQARRLIETVATDNLFLQCDLYHVQIMSGDLARTVEANLDIIRHFQIAGVPGRHEPDQGEINYPYLFNLIDSSGYSGWVGCEYHPAGDTLDGLGWAFDYDISGHGGG